MVTDGNLLWRLYCVKLSNQKDIHLKLIGNCTSAIYLNKNKIKIFFERSYTMFKWDFPGLQTYLTICKSFSIIQHINKIKNKNHIYIHP